MDKPLKISLLLTLLSVFCNIGGNACDVSSGTPYHVRRVCCPTLSNGLCAAPAKAQSVCTAPEQPVEESCSLIPAVSCTYRENPVIPQDIATAKEAAARAKNEFYTSLDAFILSPYRQSTPDSSCVQEACKRAPIQLLAAYETMAPGRESTVNSARKQLIYWERARELLFSLSLAVPGTSEDRIEEVTGAPLKQDYLAWEMKRRAYYSLCIAVAREKKRAQVALQSCAELTPIIQEIAEASHAKKQSEAEYEMALAEAIAAGYLRDGHKSLQAQGSAQRYLLSDSPQGTAASLHHRADLSFRQEVLQRVLETSSSYSSSPGLAEALQNGKAPVLDEARLQALYKIRKITRARYYRAMRLFLSIPLKVPVTLPETPRQQEDPEKAGRVLCCAMPKAPPNLK